ncbi:MAG: hypothetical protein IJU98_08850, partial [Synergistaceae bacterium]|nr:hypothetical protein [Synergistaceae bacterium]
MTLTEQQEKNALGAIGATDFTPFQAPKEPEKKPDDISADRAVSEGERQYNAILSGQNPFPTAEETLAAVESMPGVQEGMEASRKALHTETLTLEYPALAENINDALAKGWNRDKLRKYLAGREMYVRMYYTQDDLDKLLGRTDETKRDFWEAMKRQQDDGYVRIMHRDMSEDRVRDILRTAELTGLQPGTLLQAPKEFLDEAEKMAGERMGALKELLYRGFNAYANWRKGKSEKATGQARDLRELLKDDAALIAEGRAQLIQDGNHYLPQEFSAQPRSDEEMKELWRKSIEKQIADMEKSAKENEDISKNWYTNIRPSDNAIWATICGAIENSGFSIESGFLSGLAWKLGGPFGGLLMSIYNTISEADTEAGGAFVEAKNRGWNDEDAYKAFLDVRRNNLILLPFSNYGGDFLLHGAGKLFETLAATIPGTGWGQRFMRGLITRGLPLIGEAVPEGVEELAQEYFQMDALKEPINEGKLWEAFRSGMGQAVLYSLAGVGTRRAASWIMGKTPTGKAMSRIEQEAREAAELGTKIAKGEIEPDTIVGEDPVVFVPRDALSETAVRELGLEPEVMEKPLDEGEDTGEAPAAAPETAAPAAGEEAEDTTPDEIAVRKSVWDEWAAKHPEEAEALKDQVREGTKGVTAREMLERKAESVRVKAGEDPMFHSAEADEVRDTLTRQFADAGHSGELAKAEADVALRFAVVMKRTNPGVNKSLSEFTNIVVKSVTESMRETGAESYEQIIGTQGAARLDAADAGNRIDNLGIARQME